MNIVNNENSTSFEILDHSVRFDGQSLYVDGAKIDAKLKRSIFGFSMSFTGDVIKIGRNRIKLDQNGVIVNGKRYEYPNPTLREAKKSQTSTSITTDGQKKPSRLTIGKQINKPRGNVIMGDQVVIYRNGEKVSTHNHNNDGRNK